MIKLLTKKVKQFSIINNRNRILKNYYAKEMKKGKTYRASILDKTLFTLALFFYLVIYLSIKSRMVILSSFLAGLNVFFIMTLYSKFSRKRQFKKIDAINEGLKKRKVIREITGLNKEGFVKYIKILLEEHYETPVKEGDFFDLECTINGDRYGIKCIKTSIEDKIVVRELDNFMLELRRQGINEGILVSNSYFMEDLINEAKIILYDFDGIVNLLKEQDKYPTDKEIHDYIVDRFLTNRNNIKSQLKTLNLKKILQLYGLFVIFYLLSYFVKYSFYYKIIGIIIFIIVTMISGYKLTELIREKDFPLNNKK